MIKKAKPIFDYDENEIAYKCYLEKDIITERKSIVKLAREGHGLGNLPPRAMEIFEELISLEYEAKELRCSASITDIPQDVSNNKDGEL